MRTDGDRSIARGRFEYGQTKLLIDGRKIDRRKRFDKHFRSRINSTWASDDIF